MLRNLSVAGDWTTACWRSDALPSCPCCPCATSCKTARSAVKTRPLLECQLYELHSRGRLGCSCHRSVAESKSCSRKYQQSMFSRESNKTTDLNRGTPRTRLRRRQLPAVQQTRIECYQGRQTVPLCIICSDLAAPGKPLRNPAVSGGCSWCCVVQPCAHLPISILYTSKILKHFCKIWFVGPCSIIPKAAAAARTSLVLPEYRHAHDFSNRCMHFTRMSCHFASNPFWFPSFAGFCIAARQAQLSYG